MAQSQPQLARAQLIDRVKGVPVVLLVDASGTIVRRFEQPGQELKDALASIR